MTRLVKTLERVSFHWMSSVSDSALRIVNCNGLREVVLAASEPEVVAWGARPAWPPIRHVTDRGLAFLARAGATLRKLSLHACVQVTSRGLQAVLRAAPALESLELSNSVAFDLQCARTLVASCAALDTLRLTKSPSTNARALAPLAELPRLRVVRLESVGAVGDAGLAALGACASLEVLECSCPAVTDAGVASFCAAQQRAHGDGGTPPLRVLELSRARLLSCASLEHAASTLRALQELRVPAANRITGVPASVLGARLACLDVAGATLLDTQSVRSLLLTGAALGAQLTELHVIGATTVSPSVLGAALRSPRAGRLRVLSVPCVDASGAPLALHSLERLRMGELVGASATSLANVCSGAPVLRELFIDDCSAAHDEHIVRAARHLHNLVALTLRNAPAVSDSALSVLLAGLGGLLHLDVRRFARMTDTTCSIVAVSCTRLRSLCIKHCQLVTDVGITAICSPPAVLLTLRIGHCPLVHERVVYSLVAQLQHHCSVQLAGAGPLGAATTLSAALPVLSTAGASAAAESLAPANGKHAVAVARA